MSAEPAGFREFVQARSQSLLRTAWMLTGDQALTEDLMQTALARTSPHWKRVSSAGTPEAYVRTVMVRHNAAWRARLWKRERPTRDPGDEGATPLAVDDHARAEDRVVLADALASLPVRQRKAVVLRFFDDLSVEEVAQIMNCSPGTVKSQTARGLVKMGGALGRDLVNQEEM